MAGGIGSVGPVRADHGGRTIDGRDRTPKEILMKFLVTAASKHGATAEIAEWIGITLREHGADADVRPPGDVASLEGYDGVVLGSAVYVGKWLHDATEITERLGPDLRTRSVWLFSSGPVGDPLKPATDPVHIESVMVATGAREHRVFAGRIDRSVLGFGERAMVSALRVPTGDYRSRPDVEGWVRDIVTADVAAVAG
jgi:menaquinone-dependent protoporphyrinogen oxidase